MQCSPCDDRQVALRILPLTPSLGQPWVESITFPYQTRLREAPGDLAHGQLARREKPASNSEVGR